MAEAVQEKGRGLKFAEQQLLRHGWEQGKGLGREENGISEAIKVKVKCDKGGVGHNEAEQFSFHWWDHVFNKAASSLEVESDQNGVQVKKVVEEDEEGMISNKKPRKAALAKARLYGCFVKSATLLSGQELPEQKAYSSDDSSSSSDDDDKLDLSSTTMLSDADLMKACGGRTAHKGARHGLTMSAKLARLEQQEQQFMAKYGKASQSASIVAESAIASNKPAQTPEVEEAVEVHSKEQKKKKKKKRKNNDAEENVSEERADDAVTPKKKKKKRSKEGGEVALEGPASAEQPTAGVTEVDHAKKKRMKKTKTTENDSSSSHETTVTLEEKDIAGGGEEASGREQAEKATQQQSHTDLETKRKKKSSKSKQEDPVVEVIEVDAETAVIPIPKKKKKRDRAIDSLSVHGDVKHA